LVWSFKLKLQVYISTSWVGWFRRSNIWEGLLEEFQVTAQENPVASFFYSSH